MGKMLSGFARSLLSEWKHLAMPVRGRRIVIAVSGGADSTALLLAFGELIKAERLALAVTVAHLDHGLRAEAGAQDARWVAQLAADHGFDVALGRASVGERARPSRDNLEQAARRARYEFLASVARRRAGGAVLTAHTLDDQAETVILRLLRGSGAEGLGGIRPVRSLDAEGDVVLCRPLLRWARRAATEMYCRSRGVRFRADEMNADERFARVRVRQRLLPLMETFNPRAVEALARTAELLRDDADALEDLAAKLLEEACEPLDISTRQRASPLRVDALVGAGRAVRRRALRQWIARGRGDLRRVELSHILAVEKLLAGERGGRVAELPGESFVERRRGRLWYRVKRVEKDPPGN